ncbi:polyprenol phosphomannose-dependent alpha 1,6 mannosyltransferase MptB [Planotetraspora thailandica]|uniref:polyprenol phosphomannose-dependent alpha 1,6 mannosyltransferase MptB n=1 Tax=Planotetraspora thailandica TaxID=487172 RepID=UPI001EF30C37|nr:polyprenol phosphomannose-dependent alpha 1,6 mannosyltransferase MptB [Planotetraspora thailandica]
MTKLITPKVVAGPRVGVVVGGGSIVATILIGLLGPSAMVPPLRGPSWQPPYSLGVAPDGHLVIALAAAAIVLGAIGLAIGLRHACRMPPARWLLLAGCLAAVVLAFLPPSGSADHLNYAAYGRMVMLGHNPYVTVPADLPGDPVIGAVEEWGTVPSVYGPVATAVQALASFVGGDSLRLTIFVMAIVNAAAFIATALVLHRFTRHDPVRQRRAALLWTANPLIIYHLAAGMHLDTLAIAFMVAALVVARGKGILLGLGIAVKVTAGLVALGPAWELRRSPRRLAVVAGSALLTVVVAYLLAGPDSLDQVRSASQSLSLATPWKLVQHAAQALFGPGAYRVWIQLGSYALLAALAVMVLRALRADGPLDAPRVALAFAVAWLFATPYVLPWYDGLAFALLALAACPALEAFMIVRLAVLSLGYLPARQADQPPDLGWLVSVVRSQVVPWCLLALTVLLGWWAWKTSKAAGRAPTRSA